MDAKTRVRRIAGLVALLLLAAVLRLYGARNQGLWHDEVLCVHNADRPFAETVDILKRQNQPPGYHFVLHVWMGLFGRSHLALRSLSILSGLLLLLVIFQLGRDLFDERTAWWALLIATLSAALLKFTQEVTPYALYLLLCVGSSLLFVRLWIGERSRPLWVAYAVARAATLYVHYFGLFYLCVEGLWVLLHVRSRWRFVLKWSGSQIGVVLLFAPWLPVFFEQSQRVGEGGFWVPRLSLLAPANALRQWALWVPELDHGSWNAMIPVVSIAYAALLAFVLVRTLRRCFMPPPPPGDSNPFRNGPSGAALAFLYFLVPIILVIVLSLRRSIFTPKYLLACAPYCYLLVAHGLTHLQPVALDPAGGPERRNRPIRTSWTLSVGGILLALSAVACGLLLLHSGYRNPEYHRAAADIGNDWRPTDLIVVHDASSFSGMQHYLRDLDPTVVYWVAPGEKVPFWQGLEGFDKSLFTQDLEPHLHSERRIWVVSWLANRKSWEEDYGASPWKDRLNKRHEKLSVREAFYKTYLGVEVARLDPARVKSRAAEQ